MIKRIFNMLLIIVFLALLFTGVITNSFAFCIYNDTDVTLKVVEYEGGSPFNRFDEQIAPGKKKCCNWKNKSCNVERKKDSIVKFSVNIYYRNTGGRNIPHSHICDIGIKAGGWLIIKGKNRNYRCIPGY